MPSGYIYSCIPWRKNPSIDPDTGTSGQVIGTLTANRALISNSEGAVAVSVVTSAELSYLDGVTSSVQTQLNGKEPTLAKGNLTEATSNILTIVDGTNAVIGSGTTIQVTVASSGVDGYLSGTDWDTFNNKLSTSLTSANIFVGNGSNVATGVSVTGDIAIDNAGVTSISSGVIVNADVNASAAIALTKLAATTASRALASDASGFIVASSVTDTELGYVSGVTSAIQTQLNNRLTVNLTSVATGDIVYYTGSEWVNLAIGTTNQFLRVSGGGIPAWLDDTTPQGVPAGGTANQYIEKIDGTDYNTQWATLTVSKITDLTASAAEINVLDGVTTTTAQLNHLNTATSDIQVQIDAKQDSITGGASTIATADLIASRALISDTSGKVAVSSVTSTELGYLSNVTSDIQAQIDGKQTSTLSANAMLIGNGSNIASELAAGTNGYILTMVSGTPAWAASTAVTNSAANNEIPKSDGTDIISSGLFSSSTGDVTLGSSSISGDRKIDVSSSTANAGVTIETKAQGIIYLKRGDDTAGNGLAFDSTNGIIELTKDTVSSVSLFVRGAAGYSGHTTGNSVILIGGRGHTSGNTNGGDTIVRCALGNGSGTPGSVKLQTTAAANQLEVNNTGVGLFGTTPVGQASSMTSQLTSLTQAGSFTPDYAIQALTNTSPYGFVTLDEAETVLSVILNLQTRVQELEDMLSAAGGGIGVAA